MNDILETIAATKDPALAKKILEVSKKLDKDLRLEKRTKKYETLAKVEKLANNTQAVEDAKAAYIAEGFLVELEKDKNGLIKKWRLRNRRPKNQGENSGETQMTPEEFRQIFPQLPNEFGAKDIQSALLNSNIGARKLQPSLGNIIKTGNSGIEKMPGVAKGPGVRYKKKNH